MSGLTHGRRVTWATILLLALQIGMLRAELPQVPPQVVQAQQQRIEAIARAARSTLSVFPGGSVAGGGSGVIISADGDALTNFHVAQPCGNYLRCGLNDGRLYDAVLVGVDPTGDVALIKLLGRDDFPAAELGDSDSLQVGEWCFAVGNPFLLSTNLQPSVSYGMVSGVHRYQYPSGTLLEYTDCIQTDAAINPGNSGGPLFNAAGQLIGINGRCSFEKRGRVNVGVGYAISINQIRNFLGDLHSGRIVDHATLGAIVGTDEDGRVVVTNIIDSSDAYRRGLRYGDEIVAFAGRPVTTVNSFKNILGIFPHGWRMPLSYRRDGQRFDILVRLAALHTPEELVRSVQRQVELPEPPREPREPPGPPEKRQPPEPESPPGPQRPPHGVAQAPSETTMPNAVAAVFQARRGYANYYFNQWHRDRIWSRLRELSNFRDARAAWTLNGQLNDQVNVQITLSDQQVQARSTSATEDLAVVLDLSEDLSQQLQPERSGGLLVALHLWRRLLTVGPAQFGEMQYVGTAPWPRYPQLADVLLGVHDVVESRFYFDTNTGRLVGLEMFPDSDSDPCEVHFRDYRAVDGRQVPFEFEVRHGDEVFGVLKLQEFGTRPTSVEGT